MEMRTGTLTGRNLYSIGTWGSLVIDVTKNSLVIVRIQVSHLMRIGIKMGTMHFIMEMEQRPHLWNRHFSKEVP